MPRIVIFWGEGGEFTDASHAQFHTEVPHPPSNIYVFFEVVSISVELNICRGNFV